ncbi:multidrug resistance-associated protein 6, partial [Tanacetum coccineum]
LVGLSLSYALTLTGTKVFLTRWYCSLANYVVSVERIKEFMHIPPEPPAIVENNIPPSSWPSKERYIEVSSKSTTSSQRDHMYIQRRDTSRHCRKDREWQDNANNSLIPFSKA